jgi:hypothetical protein
MFSLYCPRHQARVLLGPDNIEGIATCAGGIELEWRCSCGEVGVEHLGQHMALELRTA